MRIFATSGADVMESNSLTAAQMLATQADMLINQARRFNPAVAEVPSVRLPQTYASLLLRGRTKLIFLKFNVRCLL